MIMPLIHYVILTSLKDRLFGGIILLMLIIAGVSQLMGSTALIEGPGMARALSAGGLRITLAVGIILFVTFHIRHAIDRKELNVLLSRPISRPRFVIAYASGLIGCALLLWLPTVIIMALHGYHTLEGFLFWALSLALEAIMTTCIALALGLIISSAVSASLAALSFYFCGRVIILLIMTAESGMSRTITWLDAVAPWLLKAASVLVPRFDLLAKSEWLNFGEASLSLPTLLGQSLIYIGFILLIAIADFNKREL